MFQPPLVKHEVALYLGIKSCHDNKHKVKCLIQPEDIWTRIYQIDGIKWQYISTISWGIADIVQLNDNEQYDILNWNTLLSYVSHPTYSTTFNFDPTYFKVGGFNRFTFSILSWSSSVSDSITATLSAPVPGTITLWVPDSHVSLVAESGAGPHTPPCFQHIPFRGMNQINIYLFCMV